MGCSTSNSVIHPQSMQDTLYGVLRVHFVGGLIERQLNSPNSQLTAICRMSNQEFKSKTWTKASFNNIDEAYEFMVNSRYQKYGRSLQIQLNESGLFSQSIVGVGLADLQLIIRERKKESFKIYLTNEKSKVGWIQLEVLFQQFPTFPITLLFDSVLVRRKPTTLGDLCCRIRTTIGQQVLVSTISQDKQDQPPNWRNEKFTFHILKGIIREGKIQVLHNDKQIGALSLNIEQIEQSSQFQIRISEQFYYGGNIIAGTIKFFISKGDDINSVALQMKKSAFISPSKKKLPPLNANFKSNELFKIQLSKNNPKIAYEDKIIVQNQLQNEFENHSLDSNKQQVKIQSKFQDNLINKNPTIFEGQRKNKDTEEEESKRKEEALQKERQIKQEAFERKLRQQQQSRQRQIKQQKQRQQRQTQFRISELKRIHKQQEDKRLQQLQEQRMRQLETIKLIEQERRKKLQQEQDRLKQLEQEKRLKEIEEQARKQEQKRKKLQEELRKLQQLQAQRLLQQEKKKKKIEEQQAQQKRRKQQQQQQYRKKQQLKIIQQKRKAEQLKRLKEEQQIRLKRVQEQSIETKQVFKKIQKQQVENNNQIKGGEQIKINLDQQFQRQKLQKSVIQGRKLIEQVKSKQSFQKGEQIVKQFKKIHDEQNIIKQDENIFYQKPQSKLEVIQNIPRLYIQSQIQTNNLKRSHNQFSNSKQIKGSQTDKIPITQQMKVNTKNQYDKFSTTDKLKHIELSGPSIDQTSNIIPTTNKSQQIVLPSQRQHSRLLLESALLENESDNEQDK